MYMPVFEAMGTSLVVVGYSNCPPVPGLVFHEKTGMKSRANCPLHNKAVMEYALDNPAIKTVILGGFWLNRIYDDPAAEHPLVDVDYILEKPSDTPEGRAEEFMTELAETIQKLKNAGKKVILIGPIPAYDFDVPQRLGRNLLYVGGKPVGVDEQSFRAGRAFVLERLPKLSENYIDPLPVLCREGFCYAAEGVETYYADKSHMEKNTALTLRAVFEDKLR